MSSETTNIVQARRCGFCDVFLAKLTANNNKEYSAETPVKLARAISGKISDKYSSEKIYSDDEVEDTIVNYEGTDVELELNSLTQQEKSMLFGWLHKNGFLLASQDDIAPEFALGYRSKRTNGKYEFTWLYAGKFGEGFDSNYETVKDKRTTQTDTLKGSFYARRKDGRIHIQVDESQLIDTDTDAATVIKNWFSKVQELPEESASST